MPKVAAEHTAAQVHRITRAGLHAVGGVTGLYLQVQSAVSRSWILRVKVGDRRRDFGLGAFPSVGLADARDRARTLRTELRAGVDPVAEREQREAALRAADAKRITFKDAAEACWKARSSGFKNVKHAQQWINTLEGYAYPILGTLPVGSIEVAHIVKVLEPIWQSKTETATRVRGRIEKVLAWAKANGFITGDNVARWKDNLDHLLASPTKLKKRTKKHHAALPWTRVGEFVADLRERSGSTARALEFAILTTARTQEIRQMRWREVDLDAALWTVPAAHMKAGLAHRVPLSSAAVKLLRSLPRGKDTAHVFLNPDGDALSENALLAMRDRMHEARTAKGEDGYLDPTVNRPCTPHGFRSAFKDWARSNTTYADEVSELALAHVDSDETRTAYARDELLPQRAQLMRDWAKFCGSPVALKAKVVPLRRRS